MSVSGRPRGRPRSAPPPESTLRLIRQALNSGATLEDVAEQLGVCEKTIRTWMRKYGAAVAPVAPAAEAPAAPTDTEYEKLDSLERVKAIESELVRSMHRAAATGNHKAASVAAGHLVKLLPVKTRLEKGEEGASTDTVQIERSEIEERMASVRERVQTLLDAGPLVCAECGRRLRAAEPVEKEES